MMNRAWPAVFRAGFREFARLRTKGHKDPDGYGAGGATLDAGLFEPGGRPPGESSFNPGNHRFHQPLCRDSSVPSGES